jgi:mannose-6-phosphate isomerase-like protein (cupin superfamily)
MEDEAEAPRSIDLGGVTITFVHSEPQSSYSLLEWNAPAGTRSPPVHLHHRTDEGFYVLTGAYTFLRDGDRIEAGAGEHVLVPKGLPHTFWNSGPETARCLMVLTPAGFEGYFRELAGRLAAAGSEEEEIQARRELSARHDIEVVAPPLTLP